MAKEPAKVALKWALKTAVEERGMSVVASRQLEDQLEAVAAHFTSGTTKFGILLCGKCGNGKTTILRAIKKTIDALEWVDEYSSRRNSVNIVDAASIANWCVNDSSRYHSVVHEPLLAIDDLGVEAPEIVAYGNKRYPMVELLNKRYDKHLPTFVTTNLTPSQLRKCYGERIADRFKEMMTKVVFSNPSYR